MQKLNWTLVLTSLVYFKNVNPLKLHEQCLYKLYPQVLIHFSRGNIVIYYVNAKRVHAHAHADWQMHCYIKTVLKHVPPYLCCHIVLRWWPWKLWFCPKHWRVFSRCRRQPSIIVDVIYRGNSTIPLLVIRRIAKVK